MYVMIQFIAEEKREMNVFNNQTIKHHHIGFIERTMIETCSSVKKIF